MFTIKIIGPNPHREGTQIWQIGEIVRVMEGVHVKSICAAIEAKERDCFPAGVGDPPRGLTHFAGLESKATGKACEAWINILHNGVRVASTASFRELYRLAE